MRPTPEAKKIPVMRKSTESTESNIRHFKTREQRERFIKNYNGDYSVVEECFDKKRKERKFVAKLSKEWKK